MGLAKVQEKNQLDRFIQNLLSRINDLESRLSELEGIEAIKYTNLSESNTSNPPTDAQLDTLYGMPAVVGKGFTSVINDAGLSSNFYIVFSDGAAWWIFTGTKAL